MSNCMVNNSGQIALLSDQYNPSTVHLALSIVESTTQIAEHVREPIGRTGRNRSSENSTRL